MRLIDADELSRRMYFAAFVEDTDMHMQKWDSGCWIRYKLFEQVLRGQPTIEERKKGKWIYGESECGNDGYYCDKCGNFVPWKYGEYDIDFIKEFLFCNKCGAVMRGEGGQE